MFEGFTPETFDFLWGIRMNNNREWFQAHKEQYRRVLYDPLKALGESLYQSCAKEPGMILKVTRIYRDGRLHPAEPYKDSLWLTIRQEGDDWMSAPCFYFDIQPQGASYGFGVWKLRTEAMERFRREIAAEPEKFLELLRQTEAAVGSRVTGDCYKRPKPCDDPRLAPYYAWKGNISCVRTLEPGAALFDPALAAEIGAFFRELMPLYRFFLRYQ